MVLRGSERLHGTGSLPRGRAGTRPANALCRWRQGWSPIDDQPREPEKGAHQSSVKRIAEAHPTWVRYSLGGLLTFGALNALGGGYYGLTGAAGVPTEWLEGSPFADYFVPSLILLVIVGGSFIVAAIAVFARLRAARPTVFMAAFVVLGWLAVQMAIIGFVSWMQPATAIAGLVVLILGSQLPRREGIAQ